MGAGRGFRFGANRRRRIVQGQWVALAVYGVWWLFALAFTFTAAPTAIRFITGSTNPDVLKYAKDVVKIRDGKIAKHLDPRLAGVKAS